MKKNIAGITGLFFLSLTAWSQDEILLTIGGKPVMRSEFERIYHKNNQVNGYENKSVDDYLDLFINFRMKVMEAEARGYDTMSTFVKELAGYREQLARPYLQNRKMIDDQVRIAYDHTVNEVNASHFMIKLPSNPTPSDTLMAYKHIMDIRKRIMTGEPFEKAAREESEDPSAKQNSGNLGWFSAFMMVYPFEDAAYHTPVGSLSMPVRSRYGYHLIKVNARRPALGEIKLAHIMTRGGKKDNPEKIAKANQKIQECSEMLKKGSRFAEIAGKYSEDEGSAKNGGQMRWLRSGELPPDIEQKVFALKDSGDFTEPLQSEYGWHIFQLQGRRPVASFDKLKPQLEERILRDERGKMAERTMVEGLKDESHFIMYPRSMDELIHTVDTTLYTGNWDPSIAANLIEPVFSINGKEYLQKDVANYIAQTKRYRREESLDQIVRNKCTEYIDHEILAYEKGRLENKYPEFRHLMEEYHDGILLFNIMDDMVWSRAVRDTAGLNEYFVQHQGDYYWKERADVSVYTLKDGNMLNKVTKLARKRISKKWTGTEFTRLACPVDSVPCLVITDGLYEKGDTGIVRRLKWQKGAMSVSEANGLKKIIVVNSLLEPMPKTLQEVRGQVTADYQNHLDQQWIADLRKKYPVVVNKEVMQHVR